MIRLNPALAPAVLLVISLSSRAATAPPEVEWSRTYGNSTNDEMGATVARTENGGFVAAGIYRVDSTDASDDVQVVRSNAFGDTVWTVRFGGSYGESPNKIIAGPDGTFLMVGAWNYKSPAGTDGFFMKLDANGDTLWNRVLGGSGDEIIRSVCPAADGGYMIGGFTDSKGAGEDDAWLIRTDSAGTVLWDSTYGGPQDETVRDIVPDGTGGYYLCCNTRSYGNGIMDYWLIRIDADGNRLWSRTYGGADRDEAYEAVGLPGRGVAVAGESQSFGSGAYNAWLLRLDMGGDTLWSAVIGTTGSERCNALDTTADGGFVIGGESDSYGSGSFDLWITGTDAAGTVLWVKILGGAGRDVCTELETTPDGGIIATGSSDSYGFGSNDRWLVKLAPEGVSASTDDTLIAYWNFDQGIDTVLKDAGSFGNHGAITGASWTAGVNGGALSFDGTGYVNVGPLGNLGSLSNTCTVMGWLRWTNTGSWQSVFGGYDGGMQLGFHINRRGDDLTSEIGDVVCYLRSKDAGAVGGGTVGMSYNDGQWHHFAWVFRDAGANQLELYVDGQPAVISMSIETSPLVFDNYACDLLLGARSNAGTPERFFTGSLDEFRVFSDALTPAQILAAYDVHKPGPDTTAAVAAGTGGVPLPGVGLELEFTELAGSDTVTVVQHDSLPEVERGDITVSKLFEIRKGEGIDSFRARITLPFTEYDFLRSGVCCKESLYCARYDPACRVWEPFASEVDTVLNTVSCYTDGFSVWSVSGVCRGIGCPPCSLEVTSSPPGTAWVDSLYTYSPSCIGALYGQLVSGPAAMAFNDMTVTWVPALTDTGTHPVQLVIAGLCEEAVLQFHVTVLEKTSAVNDLQMAKETVWLSGENPVRQVLGCISLKQAESVRAAVITPDARRVYPLVDGVLPDGRHRLRLPDGVPGGMYLMYCDIGPERTVMKVLVVR